MEELLKYFQKIEARLAELEEGAKAEPQQEEKLAELAKHIDALTVQNKALEALVADLQLKVKELEARPATVVAEPAAKTVADKDDVAIDEESGEPELEVEFIEDEPEADTQANEVSDPLLAAEIITEPVEETVAEETIEVAPIIEETSEPTPVKETVAESVAPTTTIADAALQGDTLSSVVPKLEDIRKGITMGDRFLFQRELFANNGELMTKTIEALNGLGSLSEAEAYIQAHFQWDKESNAYELFHNLLKRRW